MPLELQYVSINEFLPEPGGPVIIINLVALSFNSLSNSAILFFCIMTSSKILGAYLSLHKSFLLCLLSLFET